MMGGTTIIKNAETPEKVLELIKHEILKAYPVVQPDSLIIYIDHNIVTISFVINRKV